MKLIDIKLYDVPYKDGEDLKREIDLVFIFLSDNNLRDTVTTRIPYGITNHQLGGQLLSLLNCIDTLK